MDQQVKQRTSITYSDAGVDIDNATQATNKIKELARQTFNQRTLSEIGSFGGMFDGAFPSLQQPVLVASADGVGTKLKIAFLTGVHNTIGRDLVNHCVNDILVQGARPLFYSTTSPPENFSPKLWRTSSKALPMAAVKTAASCLVARRQRCQTSTPRANTMWPGSLLELQIEIR